MTTEPVRDLHAGSTIRIDAEHLSVTETYPSGGTHNVHVMRDGDLWLKLKKGDEQLSANAGNFVLVALDVDDDHDEVIVDRGDLEETLLEAIEALQASYNAARKVRQA